MLNTYFDNSVLALRVLCEHQDKYLPVKVKSH